MSELTLKLTQEEAEWLETKLEAECRYTGFSNKAEYRKALAMLDKLRGLLYVTPEDPAPEPVAAQTEQEPTEVLAEIVPAKEFDGRTKRIRDHFGYISTSQAF